MVKRKLNLNINKSIGEFESVSKGLNLDINKRKDSPVGKRNNQLPLDKKPGEGINLKKKQLLLKIWENIFIVLLVFMVIFIILIVFFYYETEVPEQEKIIQNNREGYINNVIYSKSNNSLFHLTNFNRIAKKDIQNFVIINDEECIPNISCRYVGYIRKYDLSTIIDEDVLLDKNVINCYDTLNCISNFTYLKSLEEPPSKQKIKIEKDGKNKLNIYDENNIFIAKLEKKDLGYAEELSVWFKF